VRNTIIGEGCVREVPPREDDLEGSTCKEGALNWKGELRIPSAIALGGFDAGSLAVKDFIILQVKPVSRGSFMQFYEASVKIKLVTDFAGADT